MKAPLIMAALLAASPASAEMNLPDEVAAAGTQLGIANLCRAKYGETDLFDAAFDQFRATVQTHGGLSHAEVRVTRDSLLDFQDAGEENFMTRMFCDQLRADLM